MQSESIGARQLIEEYLKHRGIRIRFDGRFDLENLPSRAQDPEELKKLLAADRPTHSSIIDQFLADQRSTNRSVSRTAAGAALRLIVAERIRDRKSAIVEPLFSPPTSDDQLKTNRGWSILASIFDMDERIVTAVLQHFVWSVKRKLSRNPAPNSCMPIIRGHDSSQLHTIFVRRFLEPLHELIFQGAQLEELGRLDDLYRYPVVCLNDMEPVSHNKIALLRRLLTNELVRSRKFSYSIENELTPIGTTRFAIKSLLPTAVHLDRFVIMPIHKRLDDRQLIDILEAVDPTLLWRSISVFGTDRSPLETRLSLLRTYQSDEETPSFVVWLRKLDFQSPHILKATTPRGVSASALHIDYLRNTSEHVSEYRFAKLMELYGDHPDMTFGPKKRGPEGVRYPIKERKRFNT